ncbi:MAG: glycosyltransferase family 39 protein, partial [Anaerolineae bacterium]|nr:glycosyltransferase family 39 protein [Anaerolineae bacterium]
VSVGLLGRSPFAIRLPSFFVGFITLAACYSLARSLFDRITARYALAVLAVTFWHIHLSRVAYRAVLLPLFSALFLTAIVRALKYNRPTSWSAGGFLYGLSWYTYMAARFTPVAMVALLVFGTAIRRNWLHKRLSARNLSLFIIPALIVLLPLGCYTISHPGMIFNRSSQVSIFNSQINGGDLPGTVLRHTLKSAGMFFIQGDHIWRHNLSMRPVWDLGLALAFILGLGVCMARFRGQPILTAVLIWTLVMLVPTLLAEDAPHFLRAVGVLPTAALIPALGLSWLQDRIARWLNGPAANQAWNAKLHILIGLPWALVLSSGLLSTIDYFIKYAQAPLTYHWFETGPVELAQSINAATGNGWTGQRNLAVKDNSKEVVIAQELWASWTSVPFLVPEESITFLDAAPLPVQEGTVFAIWPYGDWRAKVLPLLPHPSYLHIKQGPSAQGDLDPEPYPIALFLYAEALPPLPERIAEYQNGMDLYAVLVDGDPQKLIINLWWGSAKRQIRAATVFVHYMRDGIRISQDDGQPAENQLPTTTWVPGDIILDQHDLTGLTPDADKDSLRIGLYDSETGEAIPRMHNGQKVSPWLESTIIFMP